MRPFPGPGGKQQISTAGGEYPTWSRRAKELFYKGADQKIWVVSYSTDEGSFRVNKPRLWSEGRVADRGIRNRTFDMHPDGRFAVLAPQPHSESNVDMAAFVLNFFEELRQIAP